LSSFSAFAGEAGVDILSGVRTEVHGMADEWTPAVSRAIAAAQAWAQGAGAESVDPLLLLHGLLVEEEGRPATLATKAGLDWSAYRQAAPVPTVETPSTTAAPLGRTATKALDRARQLAYDLAGEAVVDSEALFRSLLDTADEVVTFLSSLGMQVEKLEAPPPLPTIEAPPLHAAVRLDDTERIDLARILDASANRAREGLRVAEDYCRFVLDDVLLCGELKRLRHDLAEALTLLPPGLLEARETQRDVGVETTTEAEWERASPAQTAQINLKRLQEALRSLEEYGKIHAPTFAAAVEGLRYRSYTVERVLALGESARRRLADARLYVLLSVSQCAAAVDWTIAEAAAGGADVIQLREKGVSDRVLLERAVRAAAAARKAGVLFIVNDRPDVARLVGADGVHLGQDDMPVKEARRILGPDALVGVSTHNVEQLRRAVLDGASYVGVGPVFPSATKQFDDMAGLEYVRSALHETTLPAFVIGGVNRETIVHAVAAGARRVAVSAAVAAADDPRQAAAELRALLPP
jgi:thiamine-phosphate pyrophosphorylase